MQLELFSKPEVERDNRSYYWDILKYPKPEVGDMVQIGVTIAKYYEKEGSRFCHMDFAMVLEFLGIQPVVLVVDPESENFMDTFILDDIDDLSPKIYTMFQYKLTEGGVPFMWDKNFPGQ